jgi:hypothetical protein
MNRLSSCFLSVIIIGSSVISAPAQADVAIPGNWTLLYDWNCDGSYGWTKMVVRSNQTWTIDEGYGGLWVREAGMLLFSFSSSKTTYGGNFASKSITGINTTFQGLKGCFYMLKEGVPHPLKIDRGSVRTETRDSQGRIKK